ncbi:MAG: nucleotidyltransferase family protein [bacterium]
MKALILSAGFGTRMSPVTDLIPKPLIPILNKPVIEYNINFLKHFGVKELYINLHHGGEKIVEALGNGKKFGVEITYLKEKEILGTGGAIANMRPFVTEPFIVINSDTIFDFDLDEMINSHVTSGKKVTIGVIPSSPEDHRAVIKIDESSTVTRMLSASFEKEIPPGNAIFTGLHIINPSLLEYIPENIFTSITGYVYKRMVEQKEQINAFFIDGKWWDIGTPDDYLECTFDLIKHLPLSYFDPFEKYHLKPEKINGKTLVVMGKNVKTSAIPLNPPLIIGDGSDVEKTAVAGPNLIIGKKVKLTKDSEVSNAVYFDGADGSKMLFSKKGKIFY